MTLRRRIKKIVSGGQTGVDRAALDVAIALGMPQGGWCPKNRKAEDGVIRKIYCLQETPSSTYKQRTQWNVRDSDGTLIITPGKLEGGTLLTKVFAEELQKPYFIFDLMQSATIHEILDWLNKNQIEILNVAGPRESKCVGIYQKAYEILQKLLKGH